MFKKPYTDEELRNLILTGTQEDLAIANQRMTSYGLKKLGVQIVVTAAIIVAGIALLRTITPDEIED